MTTDSEMARQPFGFAQDVAHDERWERERLLEALDSCQRGLSQAPYITKWTGELNNPSISPLREGRLQGSPSQGELQEVLPNQDAMKFVISTDEIDRHGDIVSSSGWRLDSFRNNPVVLWAHNYTRPAIGRALQVWIEDHTLLASIEFAPTEFAQEVAALYRDGYQKGVSVGFRPLEWEIRRDPHTNAFLGVKFTQQELLEISTAPVPANASALRKALESTPRMRTFYQAYHTSPMVRSTHGILDDILDILKTARQ